MTRVSIAMATYNGAKYVREQLDSFARQTRPPDELVVCDDRSSDDTVAILKDFARSSAFPVRVAVNQANLGFIRNFEKALSACEGDLIFLSDQDDIWFDGKVEEILRFMEYTPECLVVSHDLAIVGKDLVPSTTFHNNLRQAGRSLYAYKPGCAMAFSRSWLNISLPFPGQMAGHDYWIGGLADVINVRRVYDKPLLYHRRHDSNFSDFVFCRGKLTLSERLFGDFGRVGLKDARAGWRTTCDTFLQFRDRLNERASALDALGLRGARLIALEKIKAKQAALEGRIALASKPRYRRAPDVASFWNAGGYCEFEGWRSALKDLVR
jgi:glycosyltransferase involved in cell wall biosynthesis